MAIAQFINRRRRAGVLAAAALAVLAAAVDVVGAAQPADAAAGRPPVGLSLPAPTGRYQVGSIALHLVDHSRADPWQPDVPYRELMVSLYYPTRHAADHAPTPYMLPAAAAHFDAVDINQYLGLDLPTGQTNWAATATHVAQRAPVAGRGLPVLLYSPGLGEPRTWDTTLVTDLASRGYLVVTIDNTYESPEVQFPLSATDPDGPLRTLTLPDISQPDQLTAFLAKTLAVRAADTSFVLDSLAALDTGHNPDAEHTALPAGLTGAFNLRAVGMFGHSVGGSAAAVAMDADPRITAGLDFDGNLSYPDGSLTAPAAHGLRRPFLLVGKDGDTDTGPGWQAFLANTPGWAKELTLRGSEHASFTDAEALLPQLGLSPDALSADIGTIDPRVALTTERAYVAAFFDRWLRGRNNHLLDGPSPAHPAMEFVG
jgi:dienelactone hydrolase